MSRLPRSTSAAQGVTAAALDSFVAALDASDQEIQTVMLVKNGHVVLERAWAPYRLDERHLLFSISKSFLSMGIGLAVDAGLLSLDDKVVSFFTEQLPDKISDNLAAMELRHLLTMTTGHHEDTIPRIPDDDQMTRTFLSFEVEHQPGSHFAYNTGASYVLSVILQKVTGEKLVDYLRPRLFEPLGATEATWETSKEGVSKGGWGLSLTTESLACFGQLLLQRGSWEGRQLIPATWIDAATSKQVANDNQENADWQQGYGYQFWRSRNNAYRGDGAFGQYCVILPEYDAALIITSASPDMQATLNVVWEHLLPALQGADGDGGVPPERLELAPPTGPAPVAGDGRTYRFEANDTQLAAVRLDADGTGTFTFADGDQTQDVVIAHGGWQEQTYDLGEHVRRTVTTAHGEGDAFVATIRLLETPFLVTFTCRPGTDSLTVDARFNVGFGPTSCTLTSS